MISFSFISLYVFYFNLIPFVLPVDHPLILVIIAISLPSPPGLTTSVSFLILFLHNYTFPLLQIPFTIQHASALFSYLLPLLATPVSLPPSSLTLNFCLYSLYPLFYLSPLCYTRPLSHKSLSFLTYYHSYITSSTIRNYSLEISSLILFFLLCFIFHHFVTHTHCHHPSLPSNFLNPLLGSLFYLFRHSHLPFAHCFLRPLSFPFPLTRPSFQLFCFTF